MMEKKSILNFKNSLRPANFKSLRQIKKDIQQMIVIFVKILIPAPGDHSDYSSRASINLHSISMQQRLFWKKQA
jgi:hypothetical protein